VVLVARFSAQINKNVHCQDGWQIPERTIEWLAEYILMLEKQSPQNWSQSRNAVWRFSVKHKVFYQPIGIDDDIIYQIRYNKRMPILSPILMSASSVFLQVAREEKEYGDNCSLQKSVIEPLLRLRHMAKHHATNGECFSPVNPVNPLLHAAKIAITTQKRKLIWHFTHLFVSLPMKWQVGE